MAETTVPKAQNSESGGIGETVKEGVQYLQSVVTGTGDASKDSGESAKTAPKANDQSAGANAGSISNIADENVSEFIRDKYKSQGGDWPEQAEK